MRPEPGETLQGYELEEQLQTLGGQTTYLAKTGAESVIVKTFSLEETDDWKSVELFERSVEALSDLDLESVPSLLDSFELEDRNLQVLVREYVPGESLADRLESGWHPNEDRVREIARKTLGILERLHGRNPPIIHRDIKPGNIVLGEDDRLSLIDFGVVRTALHREETHPGTVVGTYGYMAPEQFRGHAVPATDLYGLGATLVRVLTGREPAELPYEGLQIRFREHCSIDPAVAEWVDRMLAPALEDRFASARDARQALDLDAFGDTAEHDPPSDVEIADTVPEHSETREEVRTTIDEEHAMSPDVTASRILDQAPSGCRIEGRVRPHCLEFALPARGVFEGPAGVIAGLGLVAAIPLALFLLSATIRLSNPFALLATILLTVACYFIVNRFEHGEIIEIGEGFLRVQHQLFGYTYSTSILTDIDHVEIIESGLRLQHGKRLRIWAGVDDSIDIGRHLSSPELNWFQSLLSYCLDRPEVMRRTEQLRRQLES